MPTTPEQQFNAALTTSAHSLGASLSDTQRSLMWRHYELLLEANARFNLTRIVDPAEAAVKLFADSLAPLVWLRTSGNRAARVLDVGTGGGFPGVPLAIATAEMDLTAIDSTGKKARFVEECARTLGIDNLRALHARAGEWRSPKSYHLLLFKAIGTLDRCLEFAHGLVAKDGLVIVFKGRSLSREELDAGQSKAESIGMQTWDTFDYKLPLGNESLEHTLIVYRRVQ